MITDYQWVLLGGALGDALAMSSEAEAPHTERPVVSYHRPSKWHPNALLSPGQFTDDTQIMMIVADLFADNNFSNQRYADALCEAWKEKRFRFPDGAVAHACKKICAGEMMSGTRTTTSGALPIALPFALAVEDPVRLREKLIEAVSLTHTHPAVHAGAVSIAELIQSVIQGHPDPIAAAIAAAQYEDEDLARRMDQALHLEEMDLSLREAVLRIGNDISVYQTLPLALFLIRRYGASRDLLPVAASVGGNCTTIALICGGWAGAKAGYPGIPEDLLEGLEERDRISMVGSRLFNKYGGRINPAGKK